MPKKLCFVFHFTLDSEDNNKVHRLVIESENEKFAVRKFEKKYANVNLLCMTRI